MSDLIGHKLGQYEITALLGEGGMARVYRARQPNVKRDVAIKVIESRLAHNPDFIRRFEREAETVAALNHPHILKLFDFGQQDDLLYLVMELQPGGSLQQLIRARRGLTPDTAARFLHQIASALDYAHQRSVIHRDLKPQNVLLDESSNAILTDFGIARIVGEGGVTALTGTGMAMGTPAYMPPEQWYGRNIDSRSDEYALGVVAFEMLTGQLPFDGDTPPALMQQHINEPPRSLRALRSELPQSLERVIRKALEKAADMRFQSAGELAAAFRVAISGEIPPGLETIEPPGERTAPVHLIPTVRAAMPQEDSEPVPPWRGRQGIWALGALGLITLVGIAVILLSGRGGGDVTPTAAASTTVPVVAANPSETGVPSLTSTHTATEETAPSLTLTFTSTVTETTTIAPTFTKTPLPSLTPSETLDPVAAAETLFFGGLTQTAALWTPTPTPNFTQTVGARLTEIAIASHTKTPTPSDTPTYTLTSSVTHTSTSTPIPTAAFTETPTLTFTPNLTPTIMPTPQPTLIPSGTSNTVWIPVMQDFGGVPMVLVPAGCFMMGSESGNGDAKPVHEVCFDQPFWIDRTEVTQAQFRQFGGKAANASNFTGDNLPRENVTWFEARDFCAVRGARLLTEAEWEYAARGPEGLTYPWGNEFVADNVVYGGNSNGQTANAGSRSGGVSWVGALDMSGSVWEWLADWHGETYYANSPKSNPEGPTNGTHRVQRGGSWNHVEDFLRAAYRTGVTPDSWNVFFVFGEFGLRCARSYQNDTALVVSTPSPTAIASAPTPIPAGTSNTVWAPQTQDFNGVTMVLVPAGCFMMGSESGGDDEKPVHEVCFDQPFWIDQTEVTQAQFRNLGGKAARVSNFEGDQEPRENISWFEARDFCAQRGVRLPTEAEWEYTARGPEGLAYPWRYGTVENNAVYAGNSKSETANAGSYPDGVSWVGTLDMSGNVWEWVSSLYQPYPYRANDGRESTLDTDELHVVRGGSWGVNAYDLRAANGDSSAPGTWNWEIGFRCARSSVDANPSVDSIPAPTSIAFTATLIPAGASNKVWVPVTQDFNGVTMVLVPAGCFVMGSTQQQIDYAIDISNQTFGTADRKWFDDELPSHEVCFKQPFWIDRTEVTQAQFKSLGGSAANTSNFTGDNRPVEQINWFEARDFCVLRGARLPTEAEWEFAARGPESLIFPWGNDFLASNVVYSFTSNIQTANVGSRPGGVSWVGALDMSGNVWEWVSSLYYPYPNQANDGREADTGTKTDVHRVIRGGAWNFNVNYLHAADRVEASPDFGNSEMGFRCARSSD